ncbi:hypothetical protein AAFX24_27535 [Vibrio mediterranei]|uniref:hypothetical protein n=1 Tax=Vibrio mediterranei TaxID=689 RepID=UPI0038CF0592
MSLNEVIDRVNKARQRAMMSDAFLREAEEHEVAIEASDAQKSEQKARRRTRAKKIANGFSQKYKDFEMNKPDVY